MIVAIFYVKNFKHCVDDIENLYEYSYTIFYTTHNYSTVFKVALLH